MSKQNELLPLIDALEKIAKYSVLASQAAAVADRPDIQKRFKEVQDYASSQKAILYAVLATPQQEKTDERTPADS